MALNYISKFKVWLFHVPEGKRSVFNVIAWWEKRRIPYNLVVGIVGIICLFIFFIFINLSGILQPGEDAVEPMAIFVAPFVINICYTFGWISELILRIIIPAKSRKIGPALLFAGLMFSFFVIMLPAVYWFGYCVLQFIGIIN